MSLYNIMYQIVVAATGSPLKTVHVHLVRCKNDVEIIRNITGIHQAYVSTISKGTEETIQDKQWRVENNGPIDGLELCVSFPDSERCMCC